jgi:hypothetical protein
MHDILHGEFDAMHQRRLLIGNATHWGNTPFRKRRRATTGWDATRWSLLIGVSSTT